MISKWLTRVSKASWLLKWNFKKVGMHWKWRACILEEGHRPMVYRQEQTIKSFFKEKSSERMKKDNSEVMDRDNYKPKVTQFESSYNCNEISINQSCAIPSAQWRSAAQNLQHSVSLPWLYTLTLLFVQYFISCYLNYLPAHLPSIFTP